MKILIISLIIILNPCTSGAAEWFQTFSKKDWAYQTVFVGLMVADWRQTQKLIKDPTRYEYNLILGEYPSRKYVDLYMGVSVAAHTLITYALPPKARGIWQMFWIGVEIGVVHHNYKAGITIAF